MTICRVAPVLAFLLISTACGSQRNSPRNAGERQARDGVSQENGAIILTGAALDDSQGSVLAAMTGKVPSLRVQRYRDQCPEIRLRNNVSFRGLVFPQVYVDGTRATDTCVLDSLRTYDVQRIEVYPQGYTTRPGYGTHAQGLILVFMRSG